MFRARWWTVAVFLCAAAATVSASAAELAERILPQHLVPEDALGLVLVNGLAETDAAVGKLAEKVGAQAPSLLAMLKMSSGVTEGLDEQGSGALVFLPGQDETAEPIAVLLAPVIDYPAVLRQLQGKENDEGIAEVTFMESRFLMGRAAGYAVLVEPGHGEVLKRILKAEPKLPDSLKPLSGWLAENQFAAVLMPAGLKLYCGLGVKMLRQVREQFEEMQDLMPADAQFGPVLAVFQIYEQILTACQEELVLAAVGARVDAKGALLISSRLPYRPDGQVAEALKGFGAPEEDVLTGLPAGAYVFAFGGTWTEGLSRAMLEISGAMMKAMPQLYGLSEEESEKLLQASGQSMEGLHAMSMVMGVGKSGDPLYSNIVGVMRCKDAEAYMQQYEKAMAETRRLLAKPDKSMFKEMEFEKRADGVWEMRAVIEFPKTPGAEEIPEFEETMKQVMEKMFGPGGRITVYMKIADKQHVVMAYTQEALLGPAVEAVRNPRAGLIGDESVAQTRALMPADVQLLGLLSPQGALAYANRALETVLAMEPGGFPPIKLPEFPATPPVGFGLRVAENQVQGFLVVPAPVLEGIGQYVNELQSAFAQPAMPEIQPLQPVEPEL